MTGLVQETVPLPPVTVAVIVKVSMFAEQLAVVPPFDPAQLQFQGPLPVTADAVPVVQRLDDGAMVTVVPLAMPQEPL